MAWRPAGARAATPTFIPPELLNAGGYDAAGLADALPAQTVRAGLRRMLRTVSRSTAGFTSKLQRRRRDYSGTYGPGMQLAPGEAWEPVWHVPDPDGQPIARIGFELAGDRHAGGSVYLDFLSWTVRPSCCCGDRRPADASGAAPGSTASTISTAGGRRRCRIIHDEGRGLLSQGTRDWTDYSAQAMITPHMAAATGIAVRVQGMRRYYALLLRDRDRIQLLRALDGDRVLAEAAFEWQFGQAYDFYGSRPPARTCGPGSTASCCSISTIPLRRSLVVQLGLLIEQGRAATDSVSVRPVKPV